MIRMMENVASDRKESLATSRDILKFIQGDDNGDGKATEPYELVQRITKTTEVITGFKNEITTLRGTKRTIRQGSSSKTEKKKKSESVIHEIMKKKKMIVTLEMTLEQQRKDLEEMNRGDGDKDDIDVSSESEIDLSSVSS